MLFIPNKNVINSRDELFEVIQQVRQYRFFLTYTSGIVFEMFRGQGQDSWKLESNIVRKIKDPIEIKRVEKQIVKEFHDELLKNGLSKSIQTGFLGGKFHSGWLLLQQAQHYGIPTRFMDWTPNWETALFFAVSNPKDDIYDGQFWIYFVQREQLHVDGSSATYYDSDPYEFQDSIFLNASGFLSDDYLSKIAMRRVARQNGRFLIQPYHLLNTPLESNPEHSIHLHKILIPKSAKAAIREELKQLGYTNNNLYVIDEPLIEQIKTELREKYSV